MKKALILLLAALMLLSLGTAAMASGEPSGASGEPAAAAAVEPGAYSDGVHTLVIADDMTFSMEKTGQNLEGVEFVLLVTGTVGADGSFTITGLYDGDINLIEVASADQVAADLASVQSAFQGGKADAAAAPSGEAASAESASSEPASGETASQEPASAEPASGETAALTKGGWPLSGSGDTSLAAFKTYLKAYMDCVPEMEGHEEELYGLIDAESWEAPVAMAWENWFEENAMTYDEFVAANGTYSLHPFTLTSPAA